MDLKNNSYTITKNMIQNIVIELCKKISKGDNYTESDVFKLNLINLGLVLNQNLIISMN